VVLLDIGLKGMDGFETAKRLRELPGGRDLYLLAVTGYGDEATKVRAIKSGCDDLLVKPMRWSVLQALLSKVARPAHRA
jgi:DNA-binding response OmpR family regulator